MTKASMLVVGILIGLIFTAARPLWASSDFFQSDDGLLHLFRVFQLDQTLRQGIGFPRWSPDLGYGLGYPDLNYYPPLAGYITETWHLLGFDFATAFKVTLVTAITLAILGAYAMGTEFFRDSRHYRWVGVLTAVAYVFFPYFLIDLYSRGAQTELMALAFLPWLTWSLRRALTQMTALAFVLVAVILALVTLAHSLTLVLAIPFLGAYTIIECLGLAPAQRMSTVIRSAVAAGVGAALSAFYWLPFVAELRWVKMGQGLEEIREVFQSSFIAPIDLIQLNFVYTFDLPPFSFGLVSIAIGMAGWLGTSFWGHHLLARKTVIFVGGSAFVCLAMIADVAQPIWMAFPFATLVQFPWRISSLVGLGLSLTICSLPLVIDRRLPTALQNHHPLLSLYTGVIGLLLIVSATANLSPHPITLPNEELNLARLARMEIFTQHPGMTTWGEYSPATLSAPSILNYRAANDPSRRAASEVRLNAHTPTRREFNVSSTQATALVLREFYFPTWVALLDGKPATAYPSTPLGLLTIDLPAGQHTLTVSRESTFAQNIGAAISLITAGALLGFILWQSRRRAPGALRAGGLFAGLVLPILIPNFVAITSTPATWQSLNIAATPELALIGMSIDDAQSKSGEWQIDDARASIHLRVLWHVKSTNGKNAPITWRLIDENNHVAAQRGQLPRYGTAPQQGWIANQVIEDHYDIPLRSVSAGRHRLQVAYDQAAFIDAGMIDLRQASQAINPPTIPQRIDARLGDQIRLLGYDAPRVFDVNRTYPLMLYWTTDGDVLDDYTAFAHLLDADGKLIAQRDSFPCEGLCSTTLWVPGDVVTERREINAPRHVKPGMYRLVIGLYRFEDLQRLPVTDARGEPAPDDIVEIGWVKVPMNAPGAQPTRALDVTLGSSIRLLGYDLQTARGQVNLKLHWQARERIDADYKVFVHLADEEGRVIAQSDRFSGDAMYPTSIWDANEKIIDAYSFALQSAGRYRIVVGMYAPDTGERLIVIDQQGRGLENRQIEIASFEMSQP